MQMAFATFCETRARMDSSRSKSFRTLAKVAANQARWAPSASARFRVLVTIYRTHEGRGPDADNVLKLALDAMNKIAFPDDRYVRELAAVVRQDKANPRLVVTVEEIAAA